MVNPTAQTVDSLVAIATRLNDLCLSLSGTSSAGRALTDPAGLQGAIGAVFQTAFGKQVYPSVYSRAAAILYKVVRIHAFSDGNKRTAYLLTLAYLEDAEIIVEPPNAEVAADFVESVATTTQSQDAAIRAIQSQLLEWTVDTY